ncbi:MAG TPA: gliding motility-associated C-terminal domain-containing protein, partial [Flavisolibacter sp.]
ISAAGSYVDTLISQSGCDSIATLQLSVNAVLASTDNITVCANQLPYSWNGLSVTAAGTYIDTLLTQSGCDSIITLQLTVNPIPVSNNTITICPNQLPYNWNGMVLTAAGTYADTVISQMCDSIVLLQLNVSPVVTSTQSVTICSSQLPYSWNGQSISSPGTFSDTLTAQSGCDSIATLQLNVNTVLISTETVTICSSQLPYTWNGQAITTAGTYSDTLATQSGCDSIATLQLNVSAVLTSTETVTICSNQLPFSWNGQNIQAAGTFIDTLASQSGCDSIVTLQLNVNAVLASTETATICSSQLPYSWNGQSIAAAGTYADTLLSQSGCDSLATLQLIVNAASASMTTHTVCASSLPYTWNGNQYNTSGTYTITLQNAAGCDSVATLVLDVSPIDTTFTAVTVCESQLPYTWNGNAYTAAGTYTVILNGQNGCDSVSMLQLSINQASASVTDVSICANTLPYTWNGNVYTAPGTYTVTLVNAVGCDSVATLNLQVTPLADATVSGNATICSGTSGSITVALTGTAPWSFTYTDGIAQHTVSNITASPYVFVITPAATTTYTILSVTDVKCTNTVTSSSATVTVIPAAAPIRYADDTAFAFIPLQLEARQLSPGCTYQWSPSVGLNSPTSRTPVFNYDQSTEYTIAIRTPEGCVVTDTAFVFVEKGSGVDLVVPNAWTPNGDGRNDYLYPITFRVKELKYFRVINRWGQVVFETRTLGRGWDGRLSGIEQKSDTFVWIAEAIGDDGSVIRKKGTATLIR